MSTTRSATPTAISDAIAPVIPLKPAVRRFAGAPSEAPLSAAALLVAVALALSPLFSGYYNFTSWGPLSLGAVVVLVVLALAARPAFTRIGLSAAAGIGLLLLLSFASMLWAASRDSAWTDSNRLALYCVIFAIGLLAVRERRSARAVTLILGAPALLTSVVLCLFLIGGGGEGAFLGGRLNSPIGYINGTAGLLVMGMWPWFALAESAGRRLVRAGGLAAASMIAATAVLTQSRAVVPAFLIATALVLICTPNRTRRALHLVILAVAVAVGLHWTLAVYSSTGPLQAVAIPEHALRSAGLAILAAVVVALALKLVVSVAASRLAPAARPRLDRLVGRSLTVAAVVAVAAIGIGGHTTISNQWNAFTHLQAEQSATNRFLSAGGFRYDLWRVALKEFQAHPIGGVGAGSYDSEYFRLRHNPQSVIQPHSLELQMAAELGLGGLLALLLFCGAILWAGVGRVKTLAAGDPMVRIAALGTFAAWLAATSVDWLYDIPGLAGIAFLAAALLVVPARGSALNPAAPMPETRCRRDRPAQAILVATLGVLALTAASIGRQYAATRYAANGASQVARSPAHAIRTLATAESLDPYSLSALYSISSAYARLDDYTDARAALLAAERVEPDNYVTPALLGDLATRRGEYATALAAYRRALRLDPTEPALLTAIRQTRALLR